MQTKLLTGSALFAVLSSAAFDNIDPVAVERFGNDVASYYSNIATNAEFSADLVALATALPSSVIAQISSNPGALADSLNTATTAPAWATAIPTSVANSLETILAQPVQAAADLDSLFAAPQVSSAFANSALPTSVQSALFSDPVNYIASVLTADELAPWATGLPATLQTQIGNVINQGLSTIAEDFEASYTLSGTFSSRTTTTSLGVWFGGKIAYPSTCPSRITVLMTVTVGSPSLSSSPSSSSLSHKPATATNVPAVPGSSKSSATSTGLPKGTGSVAVFTGTKSTGAPIAFTGAAAPMRTAVVGAAALFAGAGALLNV